LSEQLIATLYILKYVYSIVLLMTVILLYLIIHTMCMLIRDKALLDNLQK